MSNMLLGYVACEYGTQATINIVEAFQEQFPYLEGYDVSIMLPDKHINRAGVAAGLLPQISNNGAIITEVVK